MSLRNTMLAGGLIGLSSCSESEEEKFTKYPECGENVYVVIGGSNVYGDTEGVGGAKNYDEKFCALSHSRGINCETVKEEAYRRIQKILDSYTCEDIDEGEGVQYSAQKTSDWERQAHFSSLSSVTGTTGDCSDAIKEFGFWINEVHPVCGEQGNIEDRGLNMPRSNVR